MTSDTAVQAVCGDKHQIICRGVMGDRYGRDHSVSVKTIGECLRALDANSSNGDVADYLMELDQDGVGHVIYVDGKPIEERHLSMLLPLNSNA